METDAALGNRVLHALPNPVAFRLLLNRGQGTDDGPPRIYRHDAQRTERFRRVLTPSERTIRARIAANDRWSREDRTEASERQRRVIAKRFEDLVDPNGELDPVERAKRAENALQAHMARLALASAKARRERRAS